jgi:hypothetical protein
MSRIIPAAILNALSQPEVQPFFALELSFDSGTVRLWSGYGNRIIDGQSYLGAGQMLNIDAADETTDLAAKSMNISLNGISSDIISIALNEPYQRRPARVLFGVTDVDEFMLLFSGSMNQMTIEDSGETSTINLSLDSRLIELERSKTKRYTEESHQADHPNDTFFSFVTDLADKTIKWGPYK